MGEEVDEELIWDWKQQEIFVKREEQDQWEGEEQHHWESDVGKRGNEEVERNLIDFVGKGEIEDMNCREYERVVVVIVVVAVGVVVGVEQNEWLEKRSLDLKPRKSSGIALKYPFCLVCVVEREEE